jgi:hypothetical protein
MKDLTFLNNLGTPDEVLKAAAGYASEKMPALPKVNSHVHLPPNFSAFKNIQQIFDMARTEGIGMLGASNYYFYDVYRDFESLAIRNGIFPLFGIEVISQVSELTSQHIRINDPGNPGRMYLCGKGITRFNSMPSRAHELISIIRRGDRERMKQMVEKLGRICSERGFKQAPSEKDIISSVCRRHSSPEATIILQERHVAQALQESIFTSTPADQRAALLSTVLGKPFTGDSGNAVLIQNEIRSCLMKAGKPAFVIEQFLDFDRAKELILQLGGIPCYPVLLDGASTLCEFEKSPEALINELTSRNLTMVELIPIRNQPDVLSKYVTSIRKAGIAVVAGTEHNTLDLLPLEPFCIKGQQVPAALREIFWEGACVAAAHQYLAAHGKTGFVTPKGEPNQEYESSEARIRFFAALGAELFRRFRDCHGTR